MRSQNQGFSAVEVVLALVLVALIGAAVWVFATAENGDGPDADTEEAAIESSEDLEAAEQELLDTDFDSELDTSEFDDVLSQS